MSEASSSKPPTAVPEKRSIVTILLLTMADTTWRMFGPTLAGLFLGLWIDSLTGKAPLFTIILLLLGVAATVGLVFQQMRNVKKGKQ